MAKDFEDMRAVEWPVELEKLHRAANTAYETFAELDDLLDAKAEEDRGYIIELTGRAYALLRDLRAEGMRQLAAWEESQDTEAEREAWEEAESRRKQIANWNAVADGLQPPYPSEY